MSSKIQGIQPSVLKWARESLGYSIDEVAESLDRDPSEIAAWELGESAPTYPQLEALAYKIYKRPLAVFFLPAPPQEPELRREFRTLPEIELDRLAADTRYQLRLGQTFQVALKELNDGVNPAPHKVFKDLNLSTQGKIAPQAEELRGYLGISLEVQVGWRKEELALKMWREAVERSGIYVFKHSFKQKEISGFCLLDDDFPIIYLNNSTTKTRQIFSLFHELAHLLIGVNGISKVDDKYIEALRPREQRIERFCNAFAAEFLVPAEDFDRQIQGEVVYDDAFIKRLADRYSVSREAVARRLLDRGLLTPAEYRRRAAEWAKQMKSQPAAPGGSYYANQAAYLGESYMRLVFGKHYQGKLSLEQAADYLGVKTASVGELDLFALGKGKPA